MAFGRKRNYARESPLETRKHQPAPGTVAVKWEIVSVAAWDRLQK